MNELRQLAAEHWQPEETLLYNHLKNNTDRKLVVYILPAENGAKRLYAVAPSNLYGQWSLYSSIRDAIKDYI